jgi:hypothetical protein
MNNFNNDNVLNGFNFARLADHVFAENLTENKTVKTIKNGIKVENVNEQDIIFCKTDFILDLFNELQILPEWYNLKIITHESDYEINQSLFSRKPKCVAKWFAINVNYKHENLVPIPIGLANEHCTITLKIDDIKSQILKKEKLLYVNHRVKTNISKRKYLYDFFSTNDWCTVDTPDLSLEQFSEKISKHHYMLCPVGNGIDTHRLWESLYSGVVPVVEDHINYHNMKQLPILFIDSFKSITKEILEHNLNIFTSKNIQQLNIEWWKKYIKGE